MPRFTVVYVKRTSNTPKTTAVTYNFHDGQSVTYETENVILEELTKEYIVEKRLLPYIPFYITRYEKEIILGNNMESAIKDLEYFKDELSRLYEMGELCLKQNRKGL